MNLKLENTRWGLYNLHYTLLENLDLATVNSRRERGKIPLQMTFWRILRRLWNPS